MGDIWHKAARTGEIFNPCHNFGMFSTSVLPEWLLCTTHCVAVSLLSRVTKFPSSPKQSFITVDPTLMTKWKYSRLGYSRKILFGCDYEAYSYVDNI